MGVQHLAGVEAFPLSLRPLFDHLSRLRTDSSTIQVQSSLPNAISGGNILFVGLGSAEGISEFRSKHRLSKNRVVIVTDPTLSIHKKIGLERGLWQVQGPKGYFNRLKLKLQGFSNQTGDGDNLQQGGAMLFDENSSILWQHHNNHFGDILNTNELMNAVLMASIRKSTSN